jgi:DNA-binding NarL/FixJ family response regulator
VFTANPQRNYSGQSEVPLQRAKRNTHTARSAIAAGAFAFCERASGAVRFQVYAAADGELPVEEAASLLAMHCLIRAQRPDEYFVLVAPRRELLEPVGRRAEQLLTAGRKAAGSNVRLSVRQREVLDHVLQDLSNKEIGARLNVTERTVKFHMSRLLSKFKVRDRAGLKREATIGMLPASAAPGDTLFGFSVRPEVVGGTNGYDLNGSNGNGPRAAPLLDFRSGGGKQMRTTARQ